MAWSRRPGRPGRDMPQAISAVPNTPMHTLVAVIHTDAFAVAPYLMAVVAFAAPWRSRYALGAIVVIIASVIVVPEIFGWEIDAGFLVVMVVVGISMGFSRLMLDGERERDRAEKQQQDLNARLAVVAERDAGGLPCRLSSRLYPDWPFARLPGVDRGLARQVAVALFRAPNTLDVRSTVSSRKEAPLVLDWRRQVQVDEASQNALSDTALFQERRLTLRTRFRIWSLVSSLLARHVPFGSLAARMNGLSACFGALSVALLFAIVRGLLLLLTFHVSPVPSNRRKTAAVLAETIGVSEDEIARLTTDNFFRLFSKIRRDG